jgi:pyruvate formate lyase activating enzyme
VTLACRERFPQARAYLANGVALAWTLPRSVVDGFLRHGYVDGNRSMTSGEHLVTTKYWRRLADGRLECTLCPRACRLQEGQRGLCFVRSRLGDAIVLTTYGRSSGFCVDPIEKKPLNHFLPGTSVLSFGTAGCNLTCKFCQNWSVSKSREDDTLADAASPEAIASTAERLGCRSVAFTYNDPVIFHEYAIDVARACRRRGIKSVAVTAGYVCKEPRAEFYAHMDAANVDLKGFTERFYQRICGGQLEPVKETLLYLKHETRVWFELTTLLIPGENDSENELETMTQWVVDELGPDVPMHFTAFHPDFRMLDKEHTPLATLEVARRIARRNGVRYAYTGNMHNPEGESTYCHSCDALLVRRDRYRLSAWGLSEEGRCAACGESCAGVVQGRPGTWGARRLPVMPTAG